MLYFLTDVVSATAALLQTVSSGEPSFVNHCSARIFRKWWRDRIPAPLHNARHEGCRPINVSPHDILSAVRLTAQSFFSEAGVAAWSYFICIELTSQCRYAAHYIEVLAQPFASAICQIRSRSTARPPIRIVSKQCLCTLTSVYMYINICICVWSLCTYLGVYIHIWMYRDMYVYIYI